MIVGFVFPETEVGIDFDFLVKPYTLIRGGHFRCIKSSLNETVGNSRKQSVN